MSQVARLWSQISFLFSIYFILLYFFCIYRLTAEQCRILETAERGHNILITGQGESGKSYLNKEARNSFFGLGMYLLKSKFRIEGKLRFS